MLLDTESQNGLHVRLDGPQGSNIVWSLADSTEPEGWSSAQIETISSLLPHIRQFVRMRQALADAVALGSSLADLLDNTRLGVIHLDRRGRIVAANDRAGGLLRQGDGLAVMVAVGHSVRAIAELTGRKEDTVRWHLKRIFRKQRLKSQADLVRRVLSLDGLSKSRR